jgi:hypothetical protein
MRTLLNRRVVEYQASSFRLNGAERIKTPEQALEFVNERGYIFFWPIKGIHFPSLWTAVAGDRPVPNEHDDPGHVTWGWKDAALGKRKWYYAKVLRCKSTLISLEILPYFYTLSDNFSSLEDDHIIAYENGQLSFVEKKLYEAILMNGPMHTIELRQIIHMSSNTEGPSFNRSLERLQSEFRILPVGIADAGRWKYAFIYDLTARHYPDLPGKASLISEREAYNHLVESFYLSVGAAGERDVRRLLHWDPGISKKVLSNLVQKGGLMTDEESETVQEKIYYLPCLGN